ncbi:MAG: hypothetical protein ACKO47_00160 [Alphaproteobacteria bacterium]
MLKKLLSLSLLIAVIASCSSKNNEYSKTEKSGQASGRINSSESNTKDVFKDLE